MKALYNLAGCVAVGFAFAGMFLPLVPTTPFLLLAAFCFSRGSSTLHQWLIGHPTMGPVIRDWNQKRIIRRRTKVAATVTLVVLMIPALVGNFQSALKLVSILVSIVVLLMIWRQRSE
jgi:uncharacterized membrane protein YbaN (DUF454 family)